jgi:hypothetical protein
MRAIVLFAILAATPLAVADTGSAAPDVKTDAKIDAKTQALEKTCKEALNADPKFAEHVVATINDQTAKQHIDAADHIANNELHVIMAYAAMWIVAAGFVIFLWRRQQDLKAEIEMLRNDLAVAAKEAK